jgi:hypothetical protein
VEFREFLAVTTPAMIPQMIPIKMISASAIHLFFFQKGLFGGVVSEGVNVRS